MKNFIDSTEIEGIGNLKLHKSMATPELYHIKIKNNIRIGLGSLNKIENPKNLELLISSQSSLWEIKKIISDKIGIDPLMIKLEKDCTPSVKYNDKQNAWSLQELNILNNDGLVINSKTSSS